MSERIVSDPSQHGWVEVDGKWVWDASGSGGAGAGMVISETEPTDKVEGMQWLNPTTGLVLFWDGEKWLEMPGGKDGADGKDGVDGLWTDNGGSISYNDGNVGIGTDSPTKPGLTVQKDGTAMVSLVNTAGSSCQILFGDADSDAAGRLIYDNNGDYMRFDTGGGQERMRIDADGTVTVKGWLSGINIFRKDVGGIYFADSNVLPAGTDGNAVDDVMSLGSPYNRFKNCYLTGSVVSARHGLSVGTRDLIETLSTLRDATKDETTLEGLRDSIGNAVGGLIEKFEAMQSTATQEIER